jgi:hypothetical protein
MLRTFVSNRGAQFAQRRSGNVRSVQLRAIAWSEPNSDAPISTLHDQRVALKPKPVRQTRQHGRDRHVDASAVEICPHVRGEGTPVDRYADRRSGWE